MMSPGSNFHDQGSKKERFPNFDLDLGKMMWLCVVERSVEMRWISETLALKCCIYVDASPCNALKITH